MIYSELQDELLSTVVLVNKYNETINVATECISILEEVEDNINNEKTDVTPMLRLLEYKLMLDEPIEVSSESISDMLKTLLATIKKFFKKVWRTIYKFIIKVKKFLIESSTDIDDMLNGLIGHTVSTEKSNIGIPITIPYFLRDKSTDDKLSSMHYFYSKSIAIKKDTYIAVEDYLLSVVKILKSGKIDTFVPFKDVFNNKIAPNYNGDITLAKILANLIDPINDHANGNKYVLGYDRSNVHILEPDSSKISIIKYSKEPITIYPEYFANKYLTNHLNNLKTIKGFNRIEASALDSIDKAIGNTVKMLEKKMKEDLTKDEMRNISRYVSEVSNIIPNTLQTLELCGMSMYIDYKGILSTIYKNKNL